MAVVSFVLWCSAPVVPAAALQAPGRVAYPATGGRVFHQSSGAAATQALPLAAGGALLIGGVGVDAELMALDSDGHLRRGFGHAGVARPDLPDSIFLAAVQRPNGGVLLVGDLRNDFAMPSLSSTRVQAVTADGATDRSFGGGDGGVDTGLFDAQAAVAPDGSILIAGTAGTLTDGGYELDDRQPVVERLHPDGSPDLTFGDHGRVTPRSGPSIAVQPSGRILLAGARLSALLPDGSPDPTFDGAPVAAQAPDASLDILTRPDGAIDVVGSVSIARHRPDGSLDSTYGTEGIAAIPAVPGVRLKPLATSDGGFAVANVDRSQSPATVTVRRLSPDGRTGTGFTRRVPSFGGGIGSDPRRDHSIPPYLQEVLPPLNQEAFAPTVVLERPNGRLLLGGGVRVARPHGPSGSVGFFAAAALTFSGALDQTYGGRQRRASVTLTPTAQRVSGPYDGGLRVSGRASGPGLILLRASTPRGRIVAHTLAPVYAAGRYTAIARLTSVGGAALHAGARRLTLQATYRGVLSSTAQARRRIRVQ